MTGIAGSLRIPRKPQGTAPAGMPLWVPASTLPSIVPRAISRPFFTIRQRPLKQPRRGLPTIGGGVRSRRDTVTRAKKVPALRSQQSSSQVGSKAVTVAVMANSWIWVSVTVRLQTRAPSVAVFAIPSTRLEKDASMARIRSACGPWTRPSGRW